MRQSTKSRIQKLESQANIDELVIVITRKIVALDENTGRLYINHGYRRAIGEPGSAKYLPREFFDGEDPTLVNLINKVGGSQ